MKPTDALNSNFIDITTTCFGQPFCPSSGVLSRTSALVHFAEISQVSKKESLACINVIMLKLIKYITNSMTYEIDRVSNIVMRGRWCNIVLNVHCGRHPQQAS
jgi:hypothetical protein